MASCYQCGLHRVTKGHNPVHGVVRALSHDPDSAGRNLEGAVAAWERFASQDAKRIVGYKVTPSAQIVGGRRREQTGNVTVSTSGANLSRSVDHGLRGCLGCHLIAFVVSWDAKRRGAQREHSMPISAARYGETRYATVKGRRMAYIDEGAGDAIAWQRGNLTSSYLWRNAMPHCEGLGRLVACDLIGMGRSERLPDSGPEGIPTANIA